MGVKPGVGRTALPSRPSVGRLGRVREKRPTEIFPETPVLHRILDENKIGGKLGIDRVLLGKPNPRSVGFLLSLLWS
jgi:hypothetical protein